MTNNETIKKCSEHDSETMKKKTNADKPPPSGAAYKAREALDAVREELQS